MQRAAQALNLPAADPICGSEAFDASVQSCLG
jgi:hypothetical protein